MTRINDYFDKVVFINLPHRTDRLAAITADLAKHGIEAQRFEGIYHVDVKGVTPVPAPRTGVFGCNASHIAVLNKIVENGWERTLILEDDNLFRFEDTQERFAQYVTNVPDDWFLLYLAGQYANDRNEWAAPHVIRFNRMTAASAYGVKLSSAIEALGTVRAIGGGFDSQLSLLSETHPCYILEPRLAIQASGVSDLEGKYAVHKWNMTDEKHTRVLGPYPGPATTVPT